MNAVGLAEQESGRALGFYCGKCGRPQLPFNCNDLHNEVTLTELHRKAELCCTTSSCPKHDRVCTGGTSARCALSRGRLPTAKRPKLYRICT
jgi:hypothetical protein